MDALAAFRLIAPEFSNIPDEDTTDESGHTVYGIKTYLDFYSIHVSKKKFGKFYAEALALITAHELKMTGEGEDEGVGGISVGAAIGVSSVSEGETSISFGYNSIAASNDADADYKLTIYGRQFISLYERVIVPITIRGGCDECNPEVDS